MTLRSIYRDGPLGYRLCKAYAVAAADPVAAMRARPASSTDLPPSPGCPGFSVRADPTHRDILWIDTGFLFLVDQEARQAARSALAAAVRTVAETCRARGARLVPVGWNQPTARSLVADVHALKVLDDTHRELVTNLLRMHVPELIALTGRAAVRPTGLDTIGSSRLASSTDAISTRYLASASAQHIGRVRESLRRDDGVARLELMDVNPVGGGDPPEHVSLRFIDAQVLPISALTQGLLLQAMAMRAGALHREGRRVRAVPQRLLDRNRARAIATGMSSRFELEGDRGERVRPGSEEYESVGVVATKLLDSLTAELCALSVSADELAPITAGLAVDTTAHSGVQTENEWLLQSRGRGEDLVETIPDRLLDQDWLLVDHLGRDNRRIAAAATEVSASIWAGRLGYSAPATVDAEEGTVPARPDPPASPAPPAFASADELFVVLEDDGTDQRAAVEALRSYAAQGSPDLVGALDALPWQRAKTLRRVMRHGVNTLQFGDMPAASIASAMTAARAAALRDGRCLLVMRIAAPEWAELRRGTWLSTPLDGVGAVLINEARSTDQRGEWINVQVLAMAKEVGRS